MEDNSWRKPVDRIDDLRSEIMFYRLALCAAFLAVIGLTAVLILREVLR